MSKEKPTKNKKKKKGIMVSSEKKWTVMNASHAEQKNASHLVDRMAN
jgi:hypothetical protein